MASKTRPDWCRSVIPEHVRSSPLQPAYEQCVFAGHVVVDAEIKPVSFIKIAAEGKLKNYVGIGGKAAYHATSRRNWIVFLKGQCDGAYAISRNYVAWKGLACFRINQLKCIWPSQQTREIAVAPKEWRS